MNGSLPKILEWNEANRTQKNLLISPKLIPKLPLSTHVRDTVGKTLHGLTHVCAWNLTGSNNILRSAKQSSMFKKTGEGTPSLPRQSVSWICLCSLRCESRDLLAHAPSHMSLLTSLSVLVMHTSNYRAVISHLMRYLKESCQPFCFIPEHSFTVTQRER